MNQGQRPWAVEKNFSVHMGWLPPQASEELPSWGACSRKPTMWLERGTGWALQKFCARAGSHSPDGGSVHKSWLALTRTTIRLNARVRLSMALFSLVLHSQLLHVQALEQSSPSKQTRGWTKGKDLMLNHSLVYEMKGPGSWRPECGYRFRQHLNEKRWLLKLTLSV